MDVNAVTYITFYILSALISIGIFLYTFRRRQTPGAWYFALLALFESVWTLGYVLQLTNSTLSGQLFWNNVQFLGAVLSPLAYFWFCVKYAGVESRRLYTARPWINAITAALLLFIWTDALHHLFRTSPHLVDGGVFPRLVFVDGPAFIAYPLIGYTLVAAGTFFIVRNIFSAPRVYRLQIMTVLVGILIPWITTVVTYAGFVPVLLHDVTPLSFGFSNLIVAWALFRYRLFDLIPVAYSQVIEQMEDALIVLDPTWRIIDMNPTAQTLLSLPLDAAIGKPFLEFLPAVIEFWDPAKEACQEFELELPEENWFQVRVRPLKRKQQVTNGYIVLMQNITTRKSFEDQLRHLAITDPLTGIFNRRHFFTLASKNLETAIDTARPLAVLLMDIDHFKDTNDTLGHIAGDLLLQHLMERCAENMRPNDILARYGGEEFIVMLPDTSEAAAVQVAERLRNRIEAKPFEVAGANICITVSIGIACYDGRGDVAIDDLVNRADTGLLNAKRSGRNRIDIVSDTIS